MCNPFSFPPASPERCDALFANFDRPDRPLIVDLGSAKGDFLNTMARLACLTTAAQASSTDASKTGSPSPRAAVVDDDGATGHTHCPSECRGVGHTMARPHSERDTKVDDASSSEPGLFSTANSVGSVDVAGEPNKLFSLKPALSTPCNYIGFELREWCVQYASEVRWRLLPISSSESMMPPSHHTTPHARTRTRTRTRTHSHTHTHTHTHTPYFNGLQLLSRRP